MNYFIYRFKDINNGLLYIGRTNNLERRIIQEHFSVSGHLPALCYEDICKIEYIQLNSEIDQIIYEAILINTLKPKYNSQFKEFTNINVNVPDFQWINFDLIDKSTLKQLKLQKTVIHTYGEYFDRPKEFSDSLIIDTGVLKIDSESPLYRGELVIVTTALGDAHRALANLIARNNLDKNRKVLQINTKDSIDIMSLKLLSSISRIPFIDIIKANLTESDYINLASTVEKIGDWDLDFIPISNEEDENSIIQYIEKKRPDILIIDGLDEFIWCSNVYDKDRAMKGLMQLKLIARKYNCLVLLINELSTKKVSSRSDNRPVITDFLYDSFINIPDKIIYTFEYDLYQEYDYIEKKGLVEYRFIKNLNGIEAYGELVYFKNYFCIAEPVDRNE